MTTPLKPTAVRLTIHTWAEGMFSALAHDLELVSSALTGAATREGDTWRFEGAVPRDSIEVAGVMKRGALDTTVLKASDKRDILTKMRAEVLTSPTIDVQTTLALPVREGGERAVQLKLSLGAKTTEIPVDVSVDEQSAQYRVTGKTKLSMSSLGIKPVKGPLGAFKVKDRLDLAFDITFG